MMAPEDFCLLPLRSPQEVACKPEEFVAGRAFNVKYAVF